MEMDFRRKNLGAVIGSYFVPTGTFSVFSLVSYSIEPNMVPGRLALLVTLELISANVYIAVKHPESRGFSYIEIWMFGSQFPILLALLEYGFVLYLKKVVKISNQDEMKMFEDKIKKLDLVTMIFSFCSFTMFASIYWSVT